jgi:hypothetical protein
MVLLRPGEELPEARRCTGKQDAPVQNLEGTVDVTEEDAAEPVPRGLDLIEELGAPVEEHGRWHARDLPQCGCR